MSLGRCRRATGSVEKGPIRPGPLLLDPRVDCRVLVGCAFDGTGIGDVDGRVYQDLFVTHEKRQSKPGATSRLSRFVSPLIVADKQ